MTREPHRCKDGGAGRVGRRYDVFDPSVLIKIVVDQRTNTCAHAGAVFHGTPINCAGASH